MKFYNLESTTDLKQDGFDKRFRKFLLVAVIGHVALVGVFTFFPSLNFLSSDADVDQFIALRNSVRVDVVAMPELTVKELKTLDALSAEAKSGEEQVDTKAPVEEEKPADVNDDKAFLEEKKEESRKSFLKTIKDFSAKDVKLAKKNEMKATGTAKNDPTLDRLVLAGNKIGQGTSAVGEGSSDVPMSEWNLYGLGATEKIQNHWKLPSFLKNQNLKAKIRLKIGKTGEIIALEVLSSSGTKDFDGRAIAAIKAAAPFPYPPEGLVKKLASDGIVLGFPFE